MRSPYEDPEIDEYLYGKPPKRGSSRRGLPPAPPPPPPSEQRPPGRLNQCAWFCGGAFSSTAFAVLLVGALLFLDFDAILNRLLPLGSDYRETAEALQQTLDTFNTPGSGETALFDSRSGEGEQIAILPPTVTVAPTDTATPTRLPSLTLAPSMTPLPSDMATRTLSPTTTASATHSPTITRTPRPTRAATLTPTPSPTQTASPTPRPSLCNGMSGESPGFIEAVTCRCDESVTVVTLRFAPMAAANHSYFNFRLNGALTDFAATVEAGRAAALITQPIFVEMGAEAFSLVGVTGEQAQTSLNSAGETQGTAAQIIMGWYDTAQQPSFTFEIQAIGELTFTQEWSAGVNDRPRISDPLPVCIPPG